MSKRDAEEGPADRIEVPEDIPKISVRGLRRRSASFDDLLLMADTGNGESSFQTSDVASDVTVASPTFDAKPRHRRISKSMAFGDINIVPRRQSMLAAISSNRGSLLTKEGSKKLLFGERGRSISRQSSTASDRLARSMSPVLHRHSISDSVGSCGEDGSMSDRSSPARRRGKEKETNVLRKSVKEDIENDLLDSQPSADIVYTKLLRYTIGKAEWVLLGDNPANPDPGGRGGLGDSYEGSSPQLVIFGAHINSPKTSPRQ